MFLYPHNPMSVTLAHVESINADEPGRWLGSFKFDGWRRHVSKINGSYVWRSKPGGSGSTRPLPAALRDEFEALPWPDGIALDCEWVGPRMKSADTDTLHVFDVLQVSGQPYMAPFSDRWRQLYEIMQICHSAHVQVVRQCPNPSLMDLFAATLTLPHVEGIVVRRMDQVNQGNSAACTNHPHMFKVRNKQVRQERL